MPPSLQSSSGNKTLGNLDALNQNQNEPSKEVSGSNIFNKRRISFPINSSQGSEAGNSSITEGSASGKGVFSTSGTSKIPIKIGSRSRSRSRDGTASITNTPAAGPQSLPFHILPTPHIPSDTDESSHILDQHRVIDEVEIEDSVNNNKSNNNTDLNYIRHVSTMPRQTTQKAKREGKGSKGKNSLSQKSSNIRNNPNEETSMKSSSALPSSRYNGSDYIRKSVSS